MEGKCPLCGYNQTCMICRLKKEQQKLTLKQIKEEREEREKFLKNSWDLQSVKGKEI